MASRELRQRQTFESSNEHVDQWTSGQPFQRWVRRWAECLSKISYSADDCRVVRPEREWTEFYNYGFMEYTKWPPRFPLSFSLQLTSALDTVSSHSFLSQSPKFSLPTTNLSVYFPRPPLCPAAATCAYFPSAIFHSLETTQTLLWYLHQPQLHLRLLHHYYKWVVGVCLRRPQPFKN